MSKQDDSILREVDDAIRHDRMMALWKRYRGSLFMIAAALVVATAGGALWKNYQHRHAGESMQQLQQAQRAYTQGEYATAASGFAALSENALSAELRDLARLWHGRALAGAGQTDDAVASFAQLADKPEGKDAIWRDLACLHLAGMAADKASGCLGAGASPLASERGFAQAALLWRDGKAEEARGLLDGIASDSGVDAQTRERAGQYLAAVDADAPR